MIARPWSNRLIHLFLPRYQIGGFFFHWSPTLLDANRLETRGKMNKVARRLRISWLTLTRLGNSPICQWLLRLPNTKEATITARQQVHEEKEEETEGLWTLRKGWNVKIQDLPRAWTDESGSFCRRNEVQRVAKDFDRLQRERRQGRQLWPLGCHVAQVARCDVTGASDFTTWWRTFQDWNSDAAPFANSLAHFYDLSDAPSICSNCSSHVTRNFLSTDQVVTLKLGLWLEEMISFGFDLIKNWSVNTVRRCYSSN